jgi:hypothetical protein
MGRKAPQYPVPYEAPKINPGLNPWLPRNRPVSGLICSRFFHYDYHIDIIHII